MVKSVHKTWLKFGTASVYLLQFVCMHTCVYVCVLVYMYVCMCVCICACLLKYMCELTYKLTELGFSCFSRLCGVFSGLTYPGWVVDNSES